MPNVPAKAPAPARPAKPPRPPRPPVAVPVLELSLPKNLSKNDCLVGTFWYFCNSVCNVLYWFISPASNAACDAACKLFCAVIKFCCPCDIAGAGCPDMVALPNRLGIPLIASIGFITALPMPDNVLPPRLPKPFKILPSPAAFKPAMFSPKVPPTAVGPATDSNANGFASPLTTSLTVAALEIKAAGTCQGPGTN